MLPGQTYTPEDFLRILWRRKWLILVPGVVLATAAFLFTRTLPNKYRSETTILVVPQRIPESYIKSTVTTRIEDRLMTIQPQILSRSRLEGVITDFNLYPDLRRSLTMEDVVERMTDEIDVTIQRGDAFSVAYISEDARLAQKVTERLASLFINENLQDRALMAEGTNQFLDASLEDARRRLVEQEKRLEAYSRAHMGELPSQVQTNLNAMQAAQMQVLAIVESINRDHDRRLLLERQLAEAENATTVAISSPPPPVSSPEPAAGATTAQQLEAAAATLAGLEQRYTAEHPDVITMKRRVGDLTARLQAETAPQRPLTPAAPAVAVRPVNLAEIARQNQIRTLKSELTTLVGQVERKEAEEKRLRGVIASYQAKVDSAPTRESEMVELTRDYATLQAQYNNLAAKREDSKLAANLEQRQVGEQFKVLDPANVPERPFSPNRLLINAAGSVAGFGFGLGLAALLEYRDRTLKKQADVLRVLQIPVLAIVPMMKVSSSRPGRRTMVAAAIGLLIVGAAGILAAWSWQAF
jgi:polysaccharide chain length determinant protein (PEP-CTERM system associated)